METCTTGTSTSPPTPQDTPIKKESCEEEEKEQQCAETLEQHNGGFTIKQEVPEEEEEDEEEEDNEDEDDSIGEGSSLSVVVVKSVDQQEDEELEEDEYLYCELCSCFFINKCEMHGPPLFIPDTPVPMGGSERARRTLPPGLEVGDSGIPDAGLGVFNNGDSVPVGAHFGPYQGEVVEREEALNSPYSWMVVSRGSGGVEYVDGSRETHANWMRYVNCARTDEEQNLVAFQYRGGVYYRCCRTVYPGQELLVWYDEGYAKNLDSSFHCIWNRKCCSDENSSLQVFSCVFCALSCTSHIYFLNHIRRCHSNSLLGVEGLRLGDHLPAVGTNAQAAAVFRTSGAKPSGPSSEKGNHQCEDCEKTFPYRSALLQHCRIHTGEKPYHCADCAKSFAFRRHLRQHQRTHSGEKMYRCTQCDKSFKILGNLQRHERLHTGEKPFQCLMCGKSFSRHCHLLSHQHLHTGEKPHTCTECGKSFAERSYLKKHQRIHTREQPYICSDCGRSFTFLSTIKSHKCARVDNSEPLLDD